MSYELYYRGSSSYEDAVRNALEPSFQDLTNNYQQNTAAIHELNDTYIAGTNAQLNMQAQTQNALYATQSSIHSGFQANIQVIQNATAGVITTLRENTLTLVASNLMLKQTFTHGFNEITKSIDFGFRSMNNKLDTISQRLEIQSEQLDKLLFNTENPSLVASREFYRRALLGCKTECYKEAIDNCNAALAKNNMDYESQYLLGFIHLFGVSEDANMINIDKALEDLKQAHKLSRLNPDCPDELKSEICFFLGYARLMKSNDLLVQNKQEESIKLLNDALKASKEAYEKDNNNLDALYEQIKEHHFLGNDEEALTLFEELVRKDKKYALKGLQDKELESIWEKLEDKIKDLRDEQSDQLSRRYNQARSQWNDDIEQRRKKLMDIVFPEEEKIGSFENFYNNQLVTPDFAEDEDFVNTVYNDFNELSKQILSPFAMAENAFKSVSNCKSIIRTVRAGTSGVKAKLNSLSEDVQKTFYSYDEALNKDYFTLREMNESYWESENQNRLNSIHNSILASLGECDKTINDLENDTNNLHCYIRAQEKWSERQVELNSNRSEEVIKECEKHCSSWKQRANELIQELLSLNLKNRTLLESIMEELDTLISRSQELLKYYNSIKNDDYFDVLKKYRKFKTSPFNSSSSYFEYTLKTLKNKIEELKNPQNKERKIDSQFITEKSNSISNRHQPYNPFNINLDALKNL